MPDHRNLILLTVLIGTLMSAVDTTITILALPTMATDLKTDLFLGIWIIIIYLLVIAVLTTQFGGLGDIYGRGRIFNLGFLVFTVGSAMCGFSPGIWYVIGSRGIQAVGAALIQANGSAIIADYFNPRERGHAFGYIALGWNIGGTLGIVLGGIITTFLGWRMIFYINIPIGLIGFIIGLKYIKDDNKKPLKIDIRGMILLAVILAMLSYGATNLAGRGVNQTDLTIIAVSIALFLPFLVLEKYADNPIINLRAFREPNLTFSLLSSLTQAMGYLSVIFLLIMYLQGILGMDPLRASLLLVPGYIIASFLSPRLGRLSDRLGSRFIASAGIFLMACAVIIFMTLGLETPVYVIVAASIISGIGGSMFWPANNSSVMTSTPKELYGSISGLLRTLSSVGTLISYVISISVASLSVPRRVAFEVFLGTNSLSGNVSSAFLAGIHSAFLVCLMILIISGILSFLRRSAKPRTSLPDSYA